MDFKYVCHYDRIEPSSTTVSVFSLACIIYLYRLVAFSLPVSLKNNHLTEPSLFNGMLVTKPAQFNAEWKVKWFVLNSLLLWL